jgi:hypothetical protein
LPSRLGSRLPCVQSPRVRRRLVLQALLPGIAASSSGSGDTAFTRNFNPYANPVDFTWGGIYEPLVVVTQAGGGREYKRLASDLT